MILLPIGLVPVQVREVSSSIPLDIINKRLSLIDNSDLIKYVSNLSDYINLIFMYYKNSLGSIDKIKNDRTIFCLNQAPWKELANSKKKPLTSSTSWSLRQELVLSVISLSLTYNQLSSNLIYKIIKYGTNDNGLIKKSEETQLWNMSNNYLKNSLLHLKFLIDNDIIDENDQIMETSLRFLNFIDHLIESSLQLSMLIKLNHLELVKILEDNWNFNISSQTNFSILLKVSIYVYDQLTLLENFNINPEINQFLKIIKTYVKIYVCYYLSLENYQKDNLGLSIGLINYVNELLLKNKNNFFEVHEQDRNNKTSKLKASNFINKLKDSKKSNGGSSGSSIIKNENSTLLIKRIIQEKDQKINKDFNIYLSACCLMDLNNLIKLINVVNLKLLKENENINFDAISDKSQVMQFLTENLPSGRKVPLSIDQNWIPSCFKDNNDANEIGEISAEGYY
ncbi:hypothetical protein PACTADRAFT_34734 [Pachysolen tannophilus NRRL Y-2460]|uniref:Uncharacterized protein n=1 Tax=Pachysolen tannophilus NRRL Y-2460 TaxID=669874 RepID=A0A1E4TTC3_PACTA|nr:hypothetical protein PACTADRAFT_34734 [Pachysolen tannophilus NRRL Y-2460]